MPRLNLCQLKKQYDTWSTILTISKILNVKANELHLLNVLTNTVTFNRCCCAANISNRIFS